MNQVLEIPLPAKQVRTTQKPAANCSLYINLPKKYTDILGWTKGDNIEFTIDLETKTLIARRDNLE